MFGAGFVYPNTSICAVAKFSEKAGTASALFSSWQGLLAASTGILVSVMHSNTLINMASVLCALCLATLFCTIVFHITDKQDLMASEAETN